MQSPTPIPVTDHQWIRDPRLPVELNEINTSMWEYNWPHFAPIVNEYQQPDTEEISEPTEFITHISDRQQKQKKEPKYRFSLPMVDESMEAIEKLKQ
jgi:hypothetical protein